MNEETLLDAARLAVRRTESAFDGEIAELISTAAADLRRRGIAVPAGLNTETKQADIKPLTMRAVMLYVKAHFGVEGSLEHQERFARCYEELACGMALANEYTSEGA